MSTFDLGAFLGSLGDQVPAGQARPLVVHAADVVPLPADRVHNPTSLSLVPTPATTFELFRQEIPAGESSDMQRHHHETVHVVVSGRGHSVIEDETVTWEAGAFVYTPVWTWHRHFNDSDTEPVHFLTIENSRLLGLLGVGRRQSAGLVDVATARAQFKE